LPEDSCRFETIHDLLRCAGAECFPRHSPRAGVVSSVGLFFLGRFQIFRGSYSARSGLSRGARETLRHSITSPGTTTLLYVELRRGQKWTFMPAPGQTIAWAYVVGGSLRANGEVVNQALAIFDDIDAPIDFIAPSDIGSGR
jgi:hypothetical protein